MRKSDTEARGGSGGHTGVMMFLMMGMCASVFLVAALLPALGLPAVLAIAILLCGAMFLVHTRFMGHRHSG